MSMHTFRSSCAFMSVTVCSKLIIAVSLHSPPAMSQSPLKKAKSASKITDSDSDTGSVLKSCGIPAKASPKKKLDPTKASRSLPYEIGRASCRERV